MKHQRANLRGEYGVLYDRLVALLFESDPIDINYGFNTDEYEPEVGTILPRLKYAETVQDVETIIHEEFCRWFDAEDVGPRNRYQAIATEVWREWCDFNQPQPCQSVKPAE